MELRELRYALRALSNMARLRMVQYLAGYDEEITVTQLTRALRISQPLASWHLRKLRRAQLIVMRRVGRQVFCSLNRVRLAECLQSLSQWCESRVSTLRQPLSSHTDASDAPALHRGAQA